MFIFLCTPLMHSAVNIQEKFTPQHIQDFFCQLVYVDSGTRQHIIKLSELLPDINWSATFVAVCTDIRNHATVMRDKDVASTLAECLMVTALLPNHERIKEHLEQYQHLLFEGKAYVCNWQLDEHHQLHTRNFDGDRLILQLGVRSLTVEGTEVVNGLLLTNGIIKVNGQIILNDIDISTLIGNKTNTPTGIVTIAGNTGTVTGSAIAIEGGTDIYITGSGTSLIISVTGTTQYAVQVGNNTGGISSITNLGTAGQALTITGTATPPSFQNPPNSNVTIYGDLGAVINGTNLTFVANSAQGNTSAFSGDGLQTMSLNMTDANQSTCLGLGSPATSSSNIQNTTLGYSTFGLPLFGAERNTVAGASACISFTNGGNDNTILGYQAAQGLEGGSDNTIIGFQAAGSANANAFLRNTLVGYQAGNNYNGTETNNICLGANVAGTANENNVMRLGDPTIQPIQKTIIAGIRNNDVSANAVLINSSNQLGTISSSKRFKENIIPMPSSFSQNIFKLRPVMFNYKTDAKKTPRWGLIAQEVQEALPYLVIHDEEGSPLSVKYHELPVLMLNETQKISQKHNALLQCLVALAQEIEDLS